MMDLLCTLFELLFLVLSVALSRKPAVDKEGNGRREPVPDRPEETLEFIECLACGKPNQAGGVSCRACGALQETARA